MHLFLVFLMWYLTFQPEGTCPFFQFWQILTHCLFTYWCSYHGFLLFFFAYVIRHLLDWLFFLSITFVYPFTFAISLHLHFELWENSSGSLSSLIHPSSVSTLPFNISTTVRIASLGYPSEQPPNLTAKTIQVISSSCSISNAS